MSFDKLLEELDVMAKSFADDDQDDQKIQAAAEEGNADADDDGVDDNKEHAEPDGDEDGEGASDNDGDEPMGKSFLLRDESGAEVEAIDGTELVKSLIARIDENEGTLQKALGAAVELIGKQGAIIKSLQADMKKLAGTGKGRKTVLSIVEKPAAGEMAKSHAAAEESMTDVEFMAKAIEAQGAGRITGLEIARAESYLNKGLPVPAEIVARVLVK